MPKLLPKAGAIPFPGGTLEEHQQVYDATIGRWMGQDPQEIDAGESNLYRYAGDNPTNYTDPSGLAPPAVDAADKAAKDRQAAEKAAKEAYPENRTMIHKQEKNRIDIYFDPRKSLRVECCEEIVFTQVEQLIVDGKPMKEGDFAEEFKYKDAVTTDEKYLVDHDKEMTSPVYTGFARVGRKICQEWRPAAIRDVPETTGGDIGFYDKDNNPKGWKNVTVKYWAFPWCRKGVDRPKFYEGITWEYVRTWKDAANGDPGVSRITGYLSEPPKEFMAAFKEFNRKKNFVP